jgi:Ca-activated chloride channel family protein
MAIGAGGNGWHVESSDDLRHIFEVELKGLIAQVASAVSMGVIPADGVRVVDVLNDFELGETGRYSLPNLQAGSPLDIIVQLHVPAQSAGTKLRLADVKVGYTPQGATSAEVEKNFLELEYASAEEVERLPVDKDVVSANELLMNARARKEAVQYLDKGDYAGAQGVLEHRALDAEFQINACLLGDAELSEDVELLRELQLRVVDSSQAKVNRKDMRYKALSRTQGLNKRKE